MREGKLVVWVSSATFGHEWACEVATKLLKYDTSRNLVIYVSPTDVYEDIETSSKNLRCADIMVVCSGKSKNISNSNYEMAVFPTSSSNNKTIVYCQSVYSVHEPVAVKDVPGVTVVYCTSATTDEVVDEVVVQVGKILDKQTPVEEVVPVESCWDVPESRIYSVGVAISMIKTGDFFKCKRLAWTQGEHIFLVTPKEEDLEPYICMSLANGCKTPWMPTQADLLAEDYYSL